MVEEKGLVGEGGTGRVGMEGAVRVLGGGTVGVLKPEEGEEEEECAGEWDTEAEDCLV